MQPTSMLNMFQQQIDSTRQIADALFDGTGKFEHILLESARHACDEQIKFLQKLGEARDPQSIAAVYSALLSQLPAQLLKAQQELIRNATDTQHELSRAMRSQMNLSDSQSDDNGAGVADLYAMWGNAFKDLTTTAGGLLRVPSESTESSAGPSNEPGHTKKPRRRAG